MLRLQKVGPQGVEAPNGPRQFPLVNKENVMGTDSSSCTSGNKASRFHGKAKPAADAIIDAFQSGTLPAALALIFINRPDEDTPCRKWAWSNQLLTALAGFSDARGYRQW
jgi:hypothetical protein